MRRDGPPPLVIRRKHPVGGVTFHAIDERRFVEDLAACRAVVAAAGNQLVGEALHLGKPMLLLPEKAHAEQLMTSDFLSAMGCGDFVLLEEVGRDRVRSFVDEAGSHDTSRIAWAKLIARVGEKFPLECPNCGGDIRLIAFITEPGPIRKILTHLGEPLKPPPVSPARGPPTDWGEVVQIHDNRDVFQPSPDELPSIDIHSL